MTEGTTHGPQAQVAATDLGRTRTAWDAIADGHGEPVTPMGDWTLPEGALDHAGLADGDRFLDVAAGSGALALPAARRGADVVAVDLSPTMVQRLQILADREGRSNVEARVMEGHALDLPDDAFDVAGSRFGVAVLPDLPRALSEMVRVTRPGGRVFLVVYGPPPEVGFIDTLLEAVRKGVPDLEVPPMDPPALPFQVSDPDKLRQALAEAGLSEIEVEPADHAIEFRSADHMWDWVTSNDPIGADIAADLTEDQREMVLEVLEFELLQRTNGSRTAVLDNLVYTGVGTA